MRSQTDNVRESEVVVNYLRAEIAAMEELTAVGAITTSIQTYRRLKTMLRFAEHKLNVAKKLQSENLMF